MTFLEGMEDDETIPRQLTFKHPLKVKAKLNSKSFRFPHTRLLLGLYDYRFKHLTIMEQEDCDVITTLQTNGLAQLFGSKELESRMTRFQEGEDDEDMPTHHIMEHDEHSPCKTSEHKHYTPTRCSAKRKQEQVNLFQTKLEIEIFKDIILPKIFYIYLDKVYTTMSHCCTKGEKIVLHRN